MKIPILYQIERSIRAIRDEFKKDSIPKKESVSKKICIANHKFDQFIIEGLKKVGFKIPENDLVVVSPDDIKLRLDFQPYVLFEAFTLLDYEFFINCDKDAVLIDVGMNAGFITLQFANKPNIKKVYSFEPFMPTYQGAMNNIKLNEHLATKIETFPFGLSNKNEKMELLYEKELAGNMTIVKDLYTNNENSVFKVKNAHKELIEIRDASDVLKDILDKNKGKQIILKCDTEGSEFEIIESLNKSGLLKQIDVILMEYHFKSPKIIEKALTENNFVVFYKDGYNPKITCSMLYAVNNAPKS